jgi:geranyl-CoA carboxylase alpha subunit
VKPGIPWYLKASAMAFYALSTTAFVRLANMQAYGQSWSVRDITHQPAQGAGGAGSGRIQATMDGAIIDVLVEAGQNVRQGDTLVILEAMKMEHPVKADRDGIVGAVQASKGDQVKRSQLLVEITANETAEQESNA